MSSIKPFIALALTGIGSALVVTFKVPSPGMELAAAPTASATTSTTTGTPASSGTSAAATAAGTAATPTSDSSSSSGTTYSDGTYTGSAVNEPWGTFQVQATISNGKLTAVALASAPSDRHSGQINSYAVAQLTQEAVTAQSANIDAVSGATWTSQSYETSLQAALDAATAAAAAQQNAG